MWYNLEKRHILKTMYEPTHKLTYSYHIYMRLPSCRVSSFLGAEVLYFNKTATDA